MRTLIKIGGTLLDRPDSLAAIAKQLAVAACQHRICVVHGGGKQVTRFLEERGIESRFEGGLRVSDASVIDAVTKVIAGAVNKTLVAAVIAAGYPAVGLSGVDGSLTRAVRFDPALENVGKPVETDPKLLELLVGAGYLPVIACIAADKQGNIYNVNADTMAVSCAIGWNANRVLFLTDVEGVKDENGAVLNRLTSTEMRQLVTSGVARGGMQAKLEAAAVAMNAGLSVTIVSGSEPDVVRRALNGESAGTSLSSEVSQYGIV